MSLDLAAPLLWLALATGPAGPVPSLPAASAASAPGMLEQLPHPLPRA